MVLDRIGPIGPQGPSRKRDKDSPDKDSFSDMMVERTRKVSEVDPEEKKRGRLPGEEDTEDFSSLTEKQPSPFETTFYQKPSLQEQEQQEANIPSYDEENTKGLPSSPDFWQDISQNQTVKKTVVPPTDQKQTPDKTKTASDKKNVKDLTEDQLKIAEQKGLAQRKKATDEKWTIEERFGIKEEKNVLAVTKEVPKDMILPSDKKKELMKNPSLGPDGKPKLAPMLSPLELMKQSSKETDKNKGDTLQQFIMPSPIAQMAAQVVGTVSPTAPTDVHQLFEYMVGTVIYINQKGIEKTQVLLNSPAFANSRFYGTTIELARYSTAPDSYNIRLIGTPEAVNIFTANIDGLRETFERGNFTFNIGRISAELSTEKPLFRRKESLDQDKGGTENE